MRVPGDGAVRWVEWWRVGCGVESLHDLMRSRGVEVTLDELLTEALDVDGYLDELGWRHHALVEVARAHGVTGEVCPPLTVTDVLREPSTDDWIISVRAPEQFGEMTHLVHVTRVRGGVHGEDGSRDVEVFWPQGHLEYGERFVVPAAWLGARMTGRGMRFAHSARRECSAE